MQQIKENSYCYDDILINPCLSTVKSRKDIDLTINLGRNPRQLILKTPLISSCMSTVTESQMAIDMALQGGIGIIHRYMTIEKQVEEIKRVKRFLQYIIEEPYTIQLYDNKNDSMNDIEYTNIKLYEEYVKKYNVNSFLVTKQFNDKSLLVGIITKKDYEMWKTQSQILNCSNLIKDIMTPIEEYEHTCLKYEDCINKSLDEILQMALTKMIDTHIEKIPIITYDTCIIKGLITHKNIKHYLENKSKAAIDLSGRLLVGVAVGIKEGEMDKVIQLVEANVDLICIDVANGYNTYVGEFIKEIRSIFPQLVIMAGNVCNADGFKYLNELDVDCIRVGIGSGSICTTRLETGIGKGQWSAVNECFKYLNSLIDLNNNAKIISDGGSLGKTGNKAKALVAGASAVMLGQTLAGTLSSPGLIINRNGKKCKYFRGMASTIAHLENQQAKGKEDVEENFNAEGIDGFVEIKGIVQDVIKEINGGIKSCFSYIGCNNILDVHQKRASNKITFSIVTPIGMAETGTRIKTY
jgi:IMP dehydrogenase